MFRPIHPEGLDLQNVVQTQIPTPLRNNRPPLLATPPGFTTTQLVPSYTTKSWPDQGILLLNMVHLISDLGRSPLPKRSQGNSSPFQGSVESDKDSPNKSPSYAQQHSLLPSKTVHSSSFNPNAPTFVPMGIQPPSVSFIA